MLERWGVRSANVTPAVTTQRAQTTGHASKRHRAVAKRGTDTRDVKEKPSSCTASKAQTPVKHGCAIEGAQLSKSTTSASRCFHAMSPPARKSGLESASPPKVENRERKSTRTIASILRMGTQYRITRKLNTHPARTNIQADYLQIEGTHAQRKWWFWKRSHRYIFHLDASLRVCTTLSPLSSSICLDVRLKGRAILRVHAR